MICVGCGGPTLFEWGEPWCEECGGVMIRPDKILLRSVALVTAGEGTFRIMFDYSIKQYKFRSPRPNPRWINYAAKGGVATIDEEFRVTPILTRWAPTLEETIALARDEFGENAPIEYHEAATPKEREIIEKL